MLSVNGAALANGFYEFEDAEQAVEESTEFVVLQVEYTEAGRKRSEQLAHEKMKDSTTLEIIVDRENPNTGFGFSCATVSKKSEVFLQFLTSLMQLTGS